MGTVKRQHGFFAGDPRIAVLPAATGPELAAFFKANVLEPDRDMGRSDLSKPVTVNWSIAREMGKIRAMHRSLRFNRHSNITVAPDVLLRSEIVGCVSVKATTLHFATRTPLLEKSPTHQRKGFAPGPFRRASEPFFRASASQGC
jgi:hypothetical protein